MSLNPNKKILFKELVDKFKNQFLKSCFIKYFQISSIYIIYFIIFIKNTNSSIFKSTNVLIYFPSSIDNVTHLIDNIFVMFVKINLSFYVKNMITFYIYSMFTQPGIKSTVINWAAYLFVINIPVYKIRR